MNVKSLIISRGKIPAARGALSQGETNGKMKGEGRHGQEKKGTSKKHQVLLPRV